MTGILLLPTLLPSLAGAVVHYRLDLRFTPELQSVSGTLNLEHWSRRGQEILPLALDARCSSTSVFAGKRPLPVTRTGNRLLVTVPGNVPQGSAITIVYDCRFNDTPPADPAHNEDPTYGVAATISPEGTFLSGAVAWHPRLLDTKGTFELTAHAPPGYRLVTSGALARSEESPAGTSLRWVTRLPLPGLTLAGGPLTMIEGRVDEIPLYAFFSEAQLPLAATYLEQSARYLRDYSALLGPYPFEKFAIVENFFPTGYGFPSWTLLGASVIRLPFIVETSLAHEIVHSWWGTAVGVSPGSGNWSEGLTTYLADYRLKELESPAAARAYRLKLLRDFSTLVRVDEHRPLKDFTGRRTKADQAVGYGKGAMLFHMLRRDVGDEAFRTGLQRMAALPPGSTLSWQELAHHFGERPSAALGAWFEQWVVRGDAPRLSLAHVRMRHASGTWVIEGEVRQETARPYRLRLPLRLVTSTGPLEQELQLDAQHTPFRFRTLSPPLELLLDPDAHLFRRLDPREIPASVNNLRASRDLLVVVTDNFPADGGAALTRLLAGLRQENAPRLVEAALNDDLRSKHDLLLVGAPTVSERFPPLPGVARAGRDHVVAGEKYAVEQHALFAIGDNPWNPERKVAIFEAPTAASALAAASKIPHYGKYGYLLFRDGENVAQGEWEPGVSPARVLFERMVNR